ncbi:MAG: carotenoid 1,2-hydratase [Gemmatimonadales bacterium]|nr:MAG: carotenoid 1,2-hydratase [Gemmatimonadales bacterium]
MEPRAFRFPDDHGPHPEYRTEWWYLTGNLRSGEGERWAYQLTFFRSSLAPEPAHRRSAWNTNQLWMAHLAITDVENDRHVVSERFARGAGGLAGGQAEPFRVWLEDWEMWWDEGSAPTGAALDGPVSLEGLEREAAGTGNGEAAPGLFPLRLRASEGDWGLDLTLEAGKPPVFQGDRGLSQKGPEPGNASFYISFTRMPTEGTIRLGDQEMTVEGASWMDREWSTSALDEEHLGWDWFSLQLHDQREIMFFELRRRDGRPEPLNHGILVEPDGSSLHLNAEDVRLEVLDHWESPLDGARYPSGWRMEIPRLGVDLTVEPKVRDQEMNVSVRYWEGAVKVHGQGVEGPVEGVGFVELTGYGESHAGGDGSAGVAPR